MSVFSSAELGYLHASRRLARLATVGPDGTPHVTPVGWRLTTEQTAVEIRGHDLTATKQFRDVARTRRAALVIDDVLPPWRPRGTEVRARAEAIPEPEPVIRIHPTRIISWGLTPDGGRDARTVPSGQADGTDPATVAGAQP